MTTQEKSMKKISTTFSKASGKWVICFCMHNSLELCQVSNSVLNLVAMTLERNCFFQEKKNNLIFLTIGPFCYCKHPNQQWTVWCLLNNVFLFGLFYRMLLVGIDSGETRCSRCHFGNKSSTNSWLSYWVCPTSSSYFSALFLPPTVPHMHWNMCSSDLIAGSDDSILEYKNVL